MPTGVFIPVESMSIRVLIGIVHAFVTPGKLIRLSSSSVSSSIVIPRPPLAFRLQYDGRLKHGERCRIERRSSAANLGESMFDFGHGHDQLIGLLRDSLRLGNGDTRQQRRHIEKITFVEWRDKLRTELLVGNHCHYQQNQADPRTTQQ